MRARACMQDLARELPAEVPFWAVDSACLYPMQLTARAPAKAYIFRRGSKQTAHVPRAARACMHGSLA